MTLTQVPCRYCMRSLWASRWDCRSYFRTVCTKDVSWKSGRTGYLISLGCDVLAGAVMPSGSSGWTHGRGELVEVVFLFRGLQSALSKPEGPDLGIAYVVLMSLPFSGLGT